jgi:TonB family protein
MCFCRLHGLPAILLAVFATASPTSRADCTDTSYAKLRPPAYPPSAVAAKAEGRVLIEVTVSVDGVPGDFIVRQSSGNADLDQAALDAVSAWRFNPSICNGKATVAKAVVPFDFKLNENATTTPGEARTLSNEGASSTGATVAGKDDRELAPDQTPIGVETAAELLKQLQDDEGVMRLGVHRVDADTTLSSYLKPEDATVFDVVQSTEHGWNAVTGGGWTSLIRTRYVTTARAMHELYAQLCNGDADWCKLQLVIYLQQMRENPPPPPPPPQARRRVSGEK